MRIEGIEIEGSWAIHNKGIFKKNLSIKHKCSTCNNIYNITLNKNIKKEYIWIILEQNQLKSIFKHSFFDIGKGYFKYKITYVKAIKYIGICPHCDNNEDELFCEPTKEIISPIEYSQVMDHNYPSEKWIANKIFKEEIEQ